MNPVDDRSFMGPLVKSLRGHVDAFAASMIGSNPAHRRLERARPAAAAWVYYSTLVAWAEDHHLIDPWLRADAEPRRRPYESPEAGGIRGWLARAYAALCVHPATQCLLDPRYSQLREHTPSEEACRDLVEWWSTAPPLAYEVDAGPPSISGWIIGDILQYARDSRPDGTGGGNAQTPWWICDGILDRTLIPAADTFRDEPVLRTIDPACGTGHFLARTIDYLWEWYTTGELMPRQMKTGGVHGGEQLPPAEAIRRIIADVDGCEIDPLTAAVARLRVTVTVGDLMHRSGLLPVLRLDRIPPFQPRIAVGDSLLARRVGAAEYARLHPKLARIRNLGYTSAPAPDVGSARQDALFDLAGGAA